jgi:hypothetical protein
MQSNSFYHNYFLIYYFIDTASDKMSGRVSRQRAPVDYNNKESMVPAWLKGIQSAKSQTPPKKASKKVVSSPGSAEKENGVVDKKAAPKSKTSKSHKGSGKEKVAVAGEKKSKQKKPSTIGEKAAAQPARGRNAGLTVVPIGEFDRRSVRKLKSSNHTFIIKLIYCLFRLMCRGPQS